MQILGDILDATMQGGREGCRISNISRKANLSHYTVLEKCSKLISAGLVEPVNHDRYRIFMVTEKGLDFIHEFRKFQGLVESMNFRY